jgi:hypothetical protein
MDVKTLTSSQFKLSSQNHNFHAPVFITFHQQQVLRVLNLDRSEAARAAAKGSKLVPKIALGYSFKLFMVTAWKIVRSLD